MSAGDWQEQAACREHPDPDVFFDLDPLAVRQALEVCAACPVTEQCLEIAVREVLDDGVWGATTGEQRRTLRRRRRRNVAAGRRTA